MNENQENSDDFNLSCLKKNTYWEIYGVKRFPYRGKRKFTSLLYQSFDAGMVISNDVFGLTICQFERVYKACLARRKTKEQWILNLRYPDKSSNEYLEYLENCTDGNKAQLLWMENDLREKYLYEQLVQIVGTEIDIRRRQRLLVILDRIANLCLSNKTQILSGSLAEGLDLPNSDMDVMYVMNYIEVIKNVENFKNPVNRNNLYHVAMETCIAHPGFARLRVVAINNESPQKLCNRCPPGTCTGTQFYYSIKTFRDAYKQDFSYMEPTVHGPCISNPSKTVDIAYCIRSKYLLHNVISWAVRHRWQWPPNYVIDRIIKLGCLLVPIGPRTLSDDDTLWRLSFSEAEKILVHSFNFTQFLCYGLLKLTLKCIINTNNDIKELLCSYFLKTALFWVFEEHDINTFQLPKLHYCFSLCLDKLISWVNICFCPNYFIPEHNMFLGKINERNNAILLHVLESIQSGGIDGLLMNLFPTENRSLLSTNSESAITMLDFLLYRIEEFRVLETDIAESYKKLAFIESLLKSESSTFIVDVCKYKYAQSNQIVAQLLPSPNTKGNTYNLRKCYQRHLQNGTKMDSVSGWLLYASFYYVTGQFNVTLRLTDYVLSRCSPDMLLEYDYNCKAHRYCYRQSIHSTLTLNDRMKVAVVSSLIYIRNSSIIPQELQLQVKDRELIITPTVMSHCLRFLSFHHLGDIFNRQKALRDLYLTVVDSYDISAATISQSFTILGVCLEIAGDKDSANQCYREALQRNSSLCGLSAEKKNIKTGFV